MTTHDTGRANGSASRRPLTIAVASGKGGVGKTTTVANVAVGLARCGLSVTVIDGDMGLANLDVLLGMVPERTLEHFFREEVPLEQIVHDGPCGVRVVPAGSGLPELTRLGSEDLLRLAEGIGRLRRGCDVLLIDTAAGIGDPVLKLIQMSDRLLLVTWPEPTALVDAYAAIKVARSRRAEIPVGLVVNGVDGEAEARRVHERISTAVSRFLDGQVDLDGWIVRDPAVVDATRGQHAVVLEKPLAPASRCFERLALHVAGLAGRRLPAALALSATPAGSCEEVLH